MSKYKPTEDEMRDVWLLIMHHSKRLLVEINAAVKNAMKFAELVGIMENNGHLKGRNPTSTAKGLYQFIDGSVEPAVNRLKRYIGHRPWMDRVLKNKDASCLGWSEQTLLFLGDMLGKRGSDVYMVRVLRSGDREAMLKAYLKLHHTDPDEATLERAKRIFNEEPCV